MNLPKRQASLVCLTVVAASIFAWQLLELFTHDIVAAPPQLAPPAVAVPAPVPSAPPSSLPSSPDEQDFQALLHRYELAKLKHRLADEELAIAKAQQSIRELNQTHHAAPTATSTTHWQLKYLGQHQAHWSATLAHDEQLVNVYPGMKLTDRLAVVRINSQGVWLRAPHHVYQLTFTGTTVISLPTAAPEPPSPQAPTPIQPAPTAPASPPVLTPAPPTLPRSTAHAVTFDETVLLAMPNHSYTLKLATRDNQPDLLNLIRKHHIKNRSFLYAHPCEAGRCFSLVYGDYLTLSAAQAAQASLPAALQAFAPEVVSLHTVQNAIRKA